MILKLKCLLPRQKNFLIRFNEFIFHRACNNPLLNFKLYINFLLKKEKERKMTSEKASKNKKNFKTKKSKSIKFKNQTQNLNKISPNKVKPFKRKNKKFETEGIDKIKLKKYERGNPTDPKMVKYKFEQKKIAKREKKILYGMEQSVRSEVLLTEDVGYLEPDEDEITTQFTQSNIKDAADLLSASKCFDLKLQFGPYRMNYTRNGRFLLLGGRKGHIAALDWVRKKLLCEINVMEEAYDIAWLHQETWFAVAQKKWVFIYDSQGVEIHCIKEMHNVIRMMFLPYHFLLASVSSQGFINWLDVSTGQVVEQFPIYGKSTASSITMHPGNAMICIGQPNGVVSFWGPNSKKPAIKKLCHKQGICSIAVDPKGQNFVTASIDKTVKLWDARSLKGPFHYYMLRNAPQCMAISHKSALALGLGNMVEIYNDKIINGMEEKKIYLRHKVQQKIMNMEFCPFEDVLGVAHYGGFCSMLVPGCGEPNFDALESNPFQTKSQRREAEVKALLGKIPSELISWDPNELQKVDIPSLEEIIEAKKQLGYIKPPDIQFTPKKKAGKKGGSVKTAQRKKIMKEDFKMNYIKTAKELRGDDKPEKPRKNSKSGINSVLDRFKR